MLKTHWNILFAAFRSYSQQYRNLFAAFFFFGKMIDIFFTAHGISLAHHNCARRAIDLEWS